MTLATRSYTVGGWFGGASRSRMPGLGSADIDATGTQKRTLPEVKSTERKVDDRWILFFHKYILGESLEVENDIRWKLLTLVSPQRACVFLKGVGHI